MFDFLSHYQQANASLWKGREDTSKAERVFQNIFFPNQLTDLNTDYKKTIFLGFASDTGVRRNQGRPGAHLGPDQIRIQLAKLPCIVNKHLWDIGTVFCTDDELETAQAQLAQIISLCHQHGHRTIILGGGHEMAWGHYQGLARHYKQLGIINFDAHFDLRPYEENQAGTSGTPFSQIAAYCEKNNRNFKYCCLGIQKMGNTDSLFQRAKALGVHYLTAEELNTPNLAQHFVFLDEFMLSVDHVYLSICLDVLAEAFAPGVSAPQPLGLSPWQILPLLKYIVQSGKTVSIDVAELAPPLDPDQKTARLAAQIIAELLYCAQS